MSLVIVFCLVAAALASPAALQPRKANANVTGVAFDRIFHVWLENIDFDVRPPALGPWECFKGGSDLTVVGRCC